MPQQHRVTDRQTDSILGLRPLQLQSLSHSKMDLCMFPALIATSTTTSKYI